MKKRKVLKKRKCFMTQLPVLPVASHSVIAMRRALCLCVCRVVVYIQCSDGKTGSQEIIWLSLALLLRLIRLEASLKVDKAKKASSASLEEAGPISRAWF